MSKVAAAILIISISHVASIPLISTKSSMRNRLARPEQVEAAFAADGKLEFHTGGSPNDKPHPQDDFVDLGVGACINVNGVTDENKKHTLVLRKALSINDDGSSHQCAQTCSQNPECSGYMTDSVEKSCKLFISSGPGPHFLPSATTGNMTSGMRCFWRHQQSQVQLPDVTSDAKISDPEPIPTVIWSYWPSKNSKELPKFVSLCHKSWHINCDGYELRLLTQDTVWNWLTKEELPSTFDDLTVSQQTTTIQMALLVKYGGIWMDSSVVMLKSLKELLGEDDTVRSSFYYQSMRPEHDNRMNATWAIQSWFMMAPSQDDLLLRQKDCLWNAFSSGENQNPTSGLLSEAQTQELRSLGINKTDSQFAMDACAFKAIDDDPALAAFWNSPAVRHLNAGVSAYKLFSEAGWDESAWSTKLLQETDSDLVSALTSSDSWMIKMPFSDGPIFGNATTMDFCSVGNTFQEVLLDAGICKPHYYFMQVVLPCCILWSLWELYKRRPVDNEGIEAEKQKASDWTSMIGKRSS